MAPRWTLLLRVAMLLTGLLPWLAWLATQGLHEVIFESLSTFCHQRSERSLVLMDTVMPVCSRCAGIFAGIAAGSLWMPRTSVMSRWRGWLLGSAALMLTDVAIQDLLTHHPFHPTRICTGLLVGWLLGGGVTALLAGDDKGT